MAENATIKITDEKDLYSILPEEFREEFAIGMHGFIQTNGGGRPEELFGEWDETRIQHVKDSILDGGLRFSKHSRLLSTVSFSNDLSSYISGDVTKYGGIIVALPRVLRSESGQEMFIGSPNERSTFNQNWYRREESTSISDFILPENGVLDPMFIIGTYSLTDEGIEFTANPNHIAYNQGKVPDDFFEKSVKKLKNDLFNGEITEKELEGIIKETLAQQQMYDKYIGKIDPSMSLENRLDLAYVDYFREVQDILRNEIKIQIDDMRYADVAESEIKENIIQNLGISYIERLSKFNNEIQTLIDEMLQQQETELDNSATFESEQQDVSELEDDTIKMQYEEEQLITPSEIERTKIEISQEKVERLRMAIQEARQQGMDAETIKKYIYPFQTVKGWNMEDSKKWSNIDSKYGISEIMSQDYMSKAKQYSGFSIEMRDTIHSLTQEEIQELEYKNYSVPYEKTKGEETVSLTKFGEKSYQHFGEKIAEKLKGFIGELKQFTSGLKNRFFSKDKTEDLTDRR